MIDTSEAAERTELAIEAEYRRYYEVAGPRSIPEGSDLFFVVEALWEEFEQLNGGLS